MSYKSIFDFLNDMKKNGTKVVQMPHPSDPMNGKISINVGINDDGELFVQDNFEGQEIILSEEDFKDGFSQDKLDEITSAKFKGWIYPPKVEFQDDTAIPVSASYLFKDDNILTSSSKNYTKEFISTFGRKKFFFREKLDDGNLSPIFIQLMREEPSFTASLRRVIIQKSPPIIGNEQEFIPDRDDEGKIKVDSDGIPIYTKADVKRIDIPTACVWFNIRTNRFHMYYNKDFVSHLTIDEKKELIKHETLHILLEHLIRFRYSKNDGDNRFNLNLVANIAQDLTINSYLDKLPRGILFRGLYTNAYNKAIAMLKGPTEEITAMNIEMYIASQMAFKGHRFFYPIEETDPERRLATFILSSVVTPLYCCQAESGVHRKLPKYKEAAWYYYQILNDAKNNNGEPGAGEGGQTIDQHVEIPLPDDVTMEDFESAKKSESKRVAEEFKNESKAQGNSSSNLLKEIEKLLDNTIPWEKELSFFIKKSIKANHYSTFKKPNKRYFNDLTGEPYSTGRRQEHTSKILVLIDQSGSVGDDIVTAFFSELKALAKHATFDLYSFDTEVILDSKQTISINDTNIEFKRTACGGTSFTPATNFSNENSKNYDATIIMTDFLAELPPKSRLRRLWIGKEEHRERSQFPFDQLGSNEKVIVMKEKK